MDKSSPSWTPLGASASTDLVDARIRLHWAAQVVGAAADALLAHPDDDSHTNLFWSSDHGALLSRPLRDDKRMGLAFADLALLLLSGDEVIGRRPLASENLAGALSWAREALSAEPELAVRDYDMPAHPVSTEGAVFGPPDARFAELGRYYASAAAALGDFAGADERATSIAVWPHHFDLGGIVFLDPSSPGHTAPQIGFGMSPGDGNVEEPYFYITPWPLPENPEWPPLAAGYWHTDGFNGALLRGSELSETAPNQQRALVDAYLRSAISAGESLIAKAKMVGA